MNDPEFGAWLLAQFDAGRKHLMPEDPFWREHFLHGMIEESFRRKESVPLGVLLIDNRPLTESEIEHGRYLAKKLGEMRDWLNRNDPLTPANRRGK